jgi:sialate O-acetylesterase
MVVQRDQPVPVWGTAAEGEEISVSIDGQTKQTKASADGGWQVRLDAMEAGGPHALTVQASNSIEIKDVLVGEVWLCSGQSNMAMKVSSSADAKDEIAAAEYPRIRMSNVGQSWSVCSPKTVGGFSATAYFFGRELHKALQVPVGLINSSVGGTPIEHWFSAKDRKFIFADAKIVGSVVEVSSPEVPQPLAVRHGWAANPDCNLANEAELPAAPFRTDEY